MALFNLTIICGPSGTVLGFLFKDRKDAEAAMVLKDGRIVFDDDFGQSASIRADEVHAVCIEDLERSGDGQIERSLHQYRIQTKMQRAAQSDPTLKAAAALGNVLNHPGVAGNQRRPF